MWTSPSGLWTRRPCSRIAARCRPRAMKVTPGPFAASRAPRQPPMAPAPITATFTISLLRGLVSAAPPCPLPRMILALIGQSAEPFLVVRSPARPLTPPSPPRRGRGRRRGTPFPSLPRRERERSSFPPTGRGKKWEGVLQFPPPYLEKRVRVSSSPSPPPRGRGRGPHCSLSPASRKGSWSPLLPLPRLEEG